LPPSVDTAQLEQLRAFFEEIRGDSLYLTYDTEAVLARHVDLLLTQLVTRDQVRAAEAVDRGGMPASSAEVWPRIESTDSVKTDSKGRVRTDRRWSLVLANLGDLPARDVQFRLEPEADGEELPSVLDGERSLEVLAPGAEARYVLILFFGVTHQARCVVSWTDESGVHEHVATLRFF
jgi:hypothetical protein